MKETPRIRLEMKIHTGRGKGEQRKDKSTVNNERSKPREYGYVLMGVVSMPVVVIGLLSALCYAGAMVEAGAAVKERAEAGKPGP